MAQEENIPSFEDIYEDARHALELMKGKLHITPIDFSRTLSNAVGANVYLKLENLQKTGSFKARGAFYKIHSLPPKQRKGVVAASAGNHAQGVAWSASALGVPAVIVMPETAPVSKVEATQGYGAEVVLHGRVYDDAYRKAIQISEERGYTFIHPFDDPKVIAGQGTVMLEIAEQLKEKPDTIIVPVGGGGLISGVASVARKLYGRDVRIVGVEPVYAAKFTESLKAGGPVTVRARPGIMDGLVTKKPGIITFELTRKLVDEIVTVGDQAVSKAIFLLLERAKMVAEGAGAAGVAGLLSGKVKVREGENVVVIVSGGNIDPTRLTKVLMYELGRSGRIVKFEGVIPDEPGSLNRVLEIISSVRMNIVDITHDRFSALLEPGWAKVEVVVETPDKKRVEEVLYKLNGEGFPFRVTKY
ncbi:MAG: threonine ammonia-lyase [Desulfurococcales archaeon]|nr:threonine ammonia-lyase [Desulfurococcales archaeon]